MKAMVVVAHPDDCVIFAKPFIDNFTNWDWTIAYLTHESSSARAKEIGAYWGKRQVATYFLGFEDRYIDLVTNKLTQWTASDATAKIQNVIEQIKPELLLTHNEHGEYGHIHHKLVHSIVADTTKPAKVYFADHINYNIEYHARDSVDLDELPLHKSVISGFVTRDHGRYTLTPEAKEIINENTNA
jgi:LmbE family N-acetylglucosaminyl deacetylase